MGCVTRLVAQKVGKHGVGLHDLMSHVGMGKKGLEEPRFKLCLDSLAFDQTLFTHSYSCEWSAAA